jgi:lysophospholipase L1-like esterase
LVAERKKELVLIASFLIIIYGVGLTQALMEQCAGETPFVLTLFMQQPTSQNLRSFESELEKSSWFSQQLQPAMRFLQFVVLKETGEKALRGRDNWFFYRPGVQYLIEPWPARNGGLQSDENPVTAIRSFRDQLQTRGIQLLVLIAPGKASVYPDKLTSRAAKPETPVYAHTRHVMNELKKNGVNMIDLFTLFSQNRQENAHNDAGFYLAQDTHWSPAGMRLAAERVAHILLAEKWVEKGSIEYDWKPIPLTRFGDVLRMMNIPLTDRFYQPEELHCAQVVRNDNGERYADDPHSPVLVLGDSFLRIYERDEPLSGGFVAHLARELHFPLASIISDGGASTLVRQELSRRPSLLENKKVVIWEFVERDIRFGVEGWQNVEL